jgi:hypothetical protein
VRKLNRGSYIMTGTHLIEIPKTQIHGVKIKDSYVEVAYTDGKGSFWFKKYNEHQLMDYFREVLKGE